MPFTGDGRREVFAALRLAIDSGRLSLPREPQLLTELRALRVEYRSQGQTVELPRVNSSHCDRAVALAIGVYSLGVPSEGRMFVATGRIPGSKPLRGFGEGPGGGRFGGRDGRWT